MILGAGVETKKRPKNRLLLGCPVGFFRYRSSDFVDYEPGVLTPPDTKKEAFRLLLGCPVGFEPTTFRTTI